MRKQFENFKIFIRWLWKMFLYLRSNYLKKKDTDLYTEGFKIYRAHFWDKIRDVVVKLVRDQHIERLRCDIAIPQEDVKHAISCFAWMGFWRKAELLKEGNDYIL